ncbi:MAG: hypothetical protein ONB48_21270 [candidate division KSB1 bacterium]|nr:hypothetical protein [candidate division KSB1 bacterium]MDZ7288179.1 hypothetical protein [candidate division KSB1 bacterium]MDZ7300308.1 hypothetical protein [candidate division KSB1 bacterium]MDZ7308729.1 hypothetical protein [candidate division KSB1 bacterium]MDZ7351308.1 hypothetical protein [candidate division KSB1 bacterium]
MHTRSFGILLTGIFTTSLFATSATFKTFSTQEQLERGKARGVAINSLGQLLLAPAVQELHRPSLPAIWCAATDPQGNVYFGGGNPAVVLRLDARQKADTIFASKEVAVMAMTFATDRLYFATSPDGQIYRYSPDGKAEPVYKPGAKYVWALEPGAGGRLFAATGEPGTILQIPAAGAVETFFESEETHLRCLRWDHRAQVLYAGSSGNGYLYRLTADRKVAVLYDAPSAEIVAIALHENGDLYLAGAAAGVLPFLPPTTAPAATTGGGAETGEHEDENVIVITASGEGSGTASEGTPSGAASAEAGMGAVYRVSPNGIARILWTSRSERVHAMHLTTAYATKEENFHLLVGTGDKGKVILLNAEGSRTLLLESEASQITSLGPESNGRIVLTTANPGVVQLLGQTRRDQGEYLAEVIDAGAPAQWGAATWQTNAAASVKVFTRSGNTGKPDRTWSEWAMVPAAGSSGAIASPAGRFLQWKVVLAGGGEPAAHVREMQISYLPANLAPEITQIKIYPPGEAFPEAAQNASDHAAESSSGESGAGTPPAGRKVNQKGAQSFGWKARDENKDQLEFQLEIRGSGEKAWRELVKKYRGQVYTLDSQSLPDGEYQVRLTASDRPSNPPALALSVQKTSELFLIDNTPPVVSAITFNNTAGGRLAVFEAGDRLSRLSEAWYSLDAGEWQLLYPVDQVADQLHERFQIPLAAEARGKMLAVKVTDANGNAGFSKAVVPQ